MNALSPRWRAILTAIWRGNGRPLNLHELREAVGYSAGTGSIMYPLYALRRGGYIDWVDGQARTLTLTGKGLLAAQGYELIYTCNQDGIKPA